MRLENQLCDQSGPIRTCAGCGQRDTQRHMQRVVAGSDGQLRLDQRRTLPGRGAWVHLNPTCVSQAKKRRAFPRILKVHGPVVDETMDQDFWDELITAALSEAPRVPERE